MKVFVPVVLPTTYAKRSLPHEEHSNNELLMLKKIKHPFIVQILSNKILSNKITFVLPYLSGGDLFFHLSRCGRFQPQHVLFCAAQLVLVLEYLHGLQIIHNDLKPENVMFCDQGYIKVGVCVFFF